MTTGRHFVDLAPIRESPAFARLYIGMTISGIGAQLTLLVRAALTNRSSHFCPRCQRARG